MSLKLKVNVELIGEIQSYLNYLHDSRLKKLVANQIATLADRHSRVISAFQEAYAYGGLGEVDELLDSINESIREGAGQLGFREGCGLEHGRNGSQNLLIVMFVEFNTDRVIGQEAIPV